MARWMMLELLVFQTTEVVEEVAEEVTEEEEMTIMIEGVVLTIGTEATEAVAEGVEEEEEDMVEGEMMTLGDEGEEEEAAQVVGDLEGETGKGRTVEVHMALN